MRARYAVPVAVLALVLAGCGGSDGSEGGTSPSPSPESPGSSSPSEPTTSPTTPDSSESSPTTTATSASGGTADSPEVLDPTQDLLDWRPLDGSVDDTLTTNGDWTLTVTEAGATWNLSDGRRNSGGASAGWRISDTLLDEDWSVVVLQDPAEEQPSRAIVTDLDTGKRFTLDGRTDVPTVNGGTWALGEDQLVHATVSGGAYCLATVDLDTRRSTVGWCAPKRSGFNAAHVTDDGVTLLTFDDSRPSCRTVVTVEGDRVTPFPGVPDCKAWEGALIDDGAVWSVIPQERRTEEAHLYARVGEGYFDLGPGTSGTLTPCGDAAYFVRDPQRSGDPAALMRWSPDAGLSVVYESPKGQAFLEAPRCGGEAITVTARTSSRDEQVAAGL